MPLAAFLEARSVRLWMFFLPEQRERGKRIIGNGGQCGITIAGDVTVTEPIAVIGFMAIVSLV